MKKISVIIPIYNVEQYLEECIVSVVNQTYKNIEIICVDDCSTDRSLKIAKDFAQKDSRIKIIEHKTNYGLGPARNTGMDNATGEYILFLDSDDYLKIDILEHLYNKIISTDSDIVFSQSYAFPDLKDKKIEERTDMLNKALDCSNLKDIVVNLDNFSYVIDNIHCVAWGKLYSTDFLTRNNIRFIEGRIIHEDNGFWLKICSQFPKVSFVENIGVMYRIRQNSITADIDESKNKKKKNKHVKLVLNDVFNYLKTNSQDLHDFFVINIKKSNQYSKYFQDLHDFFVINIKKSNLYSKYFYVEFSCLFKFHWGKNDKLLSILGIQLFREKQKGNNEKIRRILGIRVHKTNLEP